MSTDLLFSDCWERGLSIIEPEDACECGEPDMPCASRGAEADQSSASEAAGGVVYWS